MSQFKNREWIALSIALFLALLTLLFYRFPFTSNSELYWHGILFYLTGFLFIFSFGSLGFILRHFVIRSNCWQTDVAVGLGSFAFFLNLYNKASITPTVPLTILLIAAALGIFFLIKNRSSTTPVVSPFQFIKNRKINTVFS